jgi:hypothetical protein
MCSPSRVKEHQSGFPQIRQGLRLLTRQKTLEVDVDMASLPAASFFNQFVVSGNNHQGSFLLFITSLPLSAYVVSLADQIGFEHRWRFVICDAEIPFEHLCSQQHKRSYVANSVMWRSNPSSLPLRSPSLFSRHITFFNSKLSATVHDFLEQSCTVAESLRRADPSVPISLETRNMKGRPADSNLG